MFFYTQAALHENLKIEKAKSVGQTEPSKKGKSIISHANILTRELHPEKREIEAVKNAAHDCLLESLREVTKTCMMKIYIRLLFSSLIYVV